MTRVAGVSVLPTLKLKVATIHKYIVENDERQVLSFIFSFFYNVLGCQEEGLVLISKSTSNFQD